MSSSLFPSRWAPLNPNIIQLYSMNTANGQKVSVCLEEMGLSYEAHLVNFHQGEQHEPEYVKINPNGKIPSLIDPHGPDGKPIALMESIVILIYLADKTGMLLPQDIRLRMEHLQWLSFQAAHIGPMFGQFGHFYLYSNDRERDAYAIERYTNETRRLLQVLENRLEGRDYIMGKDYSIVDIAILPWVLRLTDFYKAGEQLQIGDFEKVLDWQDRITAREAFKIGKQVCAAPA
jgi:GST-like protein